MEFSLRLVASLDKRLKMSHQVRDHLQVLVTKHIIQPYGLKSKWETYISMHLVGSNWTGKPIDVIIKPNTASRRSEGYYARAYTIFMSLQHINAAPGPVRAFVEFAVLGLEELFTTLYKKIKPGDFAALRADIDWAYIASLPFPAPFEEQGYLGDDQVPEEFRKYF
jgi:hypothetical protein